MGEFMSAESAAYAQMIGDVLCFALMWLGLMCVVVLFFMGAKRARSMTIMPRKKPDTGFHPNVRVCACGGSGWIPGIPDDEECPYHGAHYPPQLSVVQGGKEQ